MLGIAAGNAADTILWRAIVIMLIGWPAGYCIGIVAECAVNRNIEAYKAARPLPSDTIEEIEADVEVDGDDDNQGTGQSMDDEDAMANDDQQDLEVATPVGVQE